MGGDRLDGMRFGQSCTDFGTDARFDGLHDAIGFFGAAVLLEPSGGFGNGAAKEPNENRSGSADEDDPAPAVETRQAAGNERGGDEGRDGYGEEADKLIEGEGCAAGVLGRQFGNVNADGDHLHAQADAGEEAPEVDGSGGGLKGHDEGAGGVPQEGKAEDGAAAEAIRNRAEAERADEESGEKSGDETGEAGDSQEALGGGREDAAGVEGRSDVGGEEEVVKLEAGAEGEQQDQFAEIAGGGQAVEASRDGDEAGGGWGRCGRGGLIGAHEVVAAVRLSAAGRTEYTARAR